jgi:hypothetical protein
MNLIWFGLVLPAKTRSKFGSQVFGHPNSLVIRPGTWWFVGYSTGDPRVFQLQPATRTREHRTHCRCGSQLPVGDKGYVFTRGTRHHHRGSTGPDYRMGTGDTKFTG